MGSALPSASAPPGLGHALTPESVGPGPRLLNSTAPRLKVRKGLRAKSPGPNLVLENCLGRIPAESHWKQVCFRLMANRATKKAEATASA